MRTEPPPLLRDLAPGHLVMRCQACRHLVTHEDACTSPDEARVCMSGGAIVSLPSGWADDELARGEGLK